MEVPHYMEIPGGSEGNIEGTVETDGMGTQA